MRTRSGAAALAVLAGGCNLVLGIGDFTDQKPSTATTGSGGGTTGTGTGTTGATSTGGGNGGSGPTCFDGVKNGAETGKDCGGMCSPCADGGGCKVAGDCKSKVCSEATCAVPSCMDKVQNGSETDVDCGGATCAACGNGKMCAGGGDCGSGVCAGAACVDGFVWAKAFAAKAKAISTLSTAVDLSAHAVVGVEFSGGINFGGGSLTTAGDLDVAVARFDSSGAFLWRKQFGDASDQQLGGLAVDTAGGIIISGSFAGQIDFGGGATSIVPGNRIFVAKLDSSGGYKWDDYFGDGKNQYAPHVAVDSKGDVFVSGTLTGSANFMSPPLVSAGKGDIFVAKLSGAFNGFGMWSFRYGDANDQSGNSVAVDANGDVVMAGGLQGAGTIDFGGGPLTSSGGLDCVIAKLSGGAGSHLWSKRFGDPASFTGCFAFVDASSNVFLTGAIGGTVDFGGGPLASPAGFSAYIVKLDPTGKHLWSKLLGDIGFLYPPTLAFDGAGNVVIALTSNSTLDLGGGPLVNAGMYDAFVAKFSPSGQHLWSRRFGDGDNQSALSVAVYDKTNILLTGLFAGSIDFGGGPLVSSGLNDLFLAKLRTP